MLSENQIRNLGFKKLPARMADHNNRFLFEEDRSSILLVNDPVTAIYEIWGGPMMPEMPEKLWQGPLHKPKSLIRKLIQFGNNLPAPIES